VARKIFFEFILLSKINIVFRKNHFGERRCKDTWSSWSRIFGSRYIFNVLDCVIWFIEISNSDNMAQSVIQADVLHLPHRRHHHWTLWIGIPIIPLFVLHLFPWSGKGCRSIDSSVVAENRLCMSQNVIHYASSMDRIQRFADRLRFSKFSVSILTLYTFC